MRAAGRKSESACSTRAATSRDHAWKSVAAATAGLSIALGLEVAQLPAVEDGDARLRVGELRLAQLDELGAALVRLERFLERKLAVLHARDERLELLEGLLEREVGCGRGGGWHGSEPRDTQ